MIKIDLAKRLGSVGEYYFSRKLAEVDALRRRGRDIINLGIGSPDMPPAPEVIDALCTAAVRHDTHGYANYKGTVEVLEAAARWYARKYNVTLDAAQEILILYGSKEGLIFLCETFIDPGDEVLVPDPGYPAYAASVRLSGGEPVPYLLTRENGWMPDFEELETRDLGKVKMMILNYPHMPTGTLPGADTFARFVDFARHHNILLVHDNPYSFIRNDTPRSILEIPGAKDVAVELNSLSKSHNMAGWRVGMMVGSPEILSAVLRYKSNLNSSMFTPIQHAAAVALGLPDEWYAAVNRTYRDREGLAYRILETLGCTYSGGQAGLFAWGRLPGGATDDCFGFIDRILYEKDVFITPGGIFGDGGKEYIRVSLCADERTLENALKRLI